MYLNYTHVNIMDRIEEFFRTIGHVERIEGEVNARDCSAVDDDLIANSSKLQVFVCKEDLDCLELGELPSNEVVNSFERFQPSHKLDKRILDVVSGNAAAARGRRQGHSRFVSSERDREH